MKKYPTKKTMNNLPNELLLKIFGKVDWEYQIENPLNVICQKWNKLIKQYGIDFDTDYTTTARLRQMGDRGYETHFIIIRDKKLTKRAITIFYRNCDNKKLQKLLLKIPVYFLKLDYGLQFTSKLLNFHNKHLKWIEFCKCRKQKESFEPINYRLDSKDFYNDDPLKFQYGFNLKKVVFCDIFIYHRIFDFVKKYNKLVKIEFKKSYFFNWSEENNLSDLFSCKQYKNNFSISFSDCRFERKELNTNKYITLKDNTYLIKNILYTFQEDTNKWKVEN
jgi:hypothetical protein